MIGKDLSAVLVLGRHGEMVGLVTSPDEVMADVAGGMVTVAGEVRCKSMLPLVLATIRAVAGVVDVEGHLRYAVDDTRVPAKPGSVP